MSTLEANYYSRILSAHKGMHVFTVNAHSMNAIDNSEFNLDLSRHSNSDRYRLKPEIALQLAINYPEHCEEIKGDWLRSTRTL